MVKTWMLMAAVTAGAAAQTDFRNATWGMTLAQVKTTEPSAPGSIIENGGEFVLIYDSARLGALRARVLYVFAKEDRLVRAKYLFEDQHADLNEFIRDYKKLEPLLAEKHGKPSLERAVWEDDSTQLEPKSYLDQDRASPANILPSDVNVGLAVSLGHLKLLTRWEAPRTQILHSLTGQDHQITHQVEYRSVDPASKAPKP